MNVTLCSHFGAGTASTVVACWTFHGPHKTPSPLARKGFAEPRSTTSLASRWPRRRNGLRFEPPAARALLPARRPLRKIGSMASVSQSQA